MPRVIQRSNVLRSSQLSVPRPLRAGAAERRAACPRRPPAAWPPRSAAARGRPRDPSPVTFAALSPWCRDPTRSRCRRARRRARVPLLRPSSPLARSAPFSSAATSSAVKNSRPPTLAGRSNGVIVRFEIRPLEIRLAPGRAGGVHFFAAGVAAGAAAGVLRHADGADTEAMVAYAMASESLHDEPAWPVMRPPGRASQPRNRSAR